MEAFRGSEISASATFSQTTAAEDERSGARSPEESSMDASVDEIPDSRKNSEPFDNTANLFKRLSVAKQGG